jgi:DNA mismatch repair protein MSH3
MSLAAVANQSGYTKPIFVDEDELDISGGRHPMIEALRSDPFVPNTISIGGVSRSE